jgi:hypothetical protein
MPSSTGCDAYQVIVPIEDTKTLTTTAVQALYETTTNVLSFVVQPHPANVGAVKIGYGTAPQNEQSFASGFCGKGFRFNLADLRVQAATANDKVIVTYSLYPSD